MKARCTGCGLRAVPSPSSVTIFCLSLSVDSGVTQFDLACFYTGEEANQQAAARGDEVPVPNDVYIVNDNPATRDVPVDPSAELLLIDWNACCETGPGATLDGLASGLGGAVDVVSPSGHTTTAGLLTSCVEVSGGEAELVWVPEGTLAAEGVEPWTQLPCWVPEGGEFAGFLEADTSRAAATGLRCRPVTATVAGWGMAGISASPGRRRSG